MEYPLLQRVRGESNAKANHACYRKRLMTVHMEFRKRSFPSNSLRYSSIIGCKCGNISNLAQKTKL